MKQFILKGIYRFLQALVWVTYAIYFRRIVFINRQYLTSKGPLIVVSNHPNTLMDPLMVLYKMRETCYALANYSLFKNPVSNFILSNFFCIPIKRMSDVGEGQALNNEDSFKQCDTHLQAGRNLYIAVEGSSFPERHIREVKTGMARIAFSAESKNNFELDLRILPVSITYFDGLKFRKDVIVEVGEPLSVDSWQAAYGENPRKAVSDFSKVVENQLIDMTIHCKNADEDAFLKKLEIILQSEEYLDTLSHYKRSKLLLSQLHTWEEVDTEGYISFKKEVDSYFAQLKALNVQDCNLEKVQKQVPLSILMLCALSPLFLYGFINNIIPAQLCNRMIKWLNIDNAYDTTIRYMSGLILFPIFWWLQKSVFSYFLFQPINGWIYLLTVVSTGLIAYNFWLEVIKIRDYWRRKNATNQKMLQKLRLSIVTSINSKKK